MGNSDSKPNARGEKKQSSPPECSKRDGERLGTISAKTTYLDTPWFPSGSKVAGSKTLSVSNNCTDKHQIPMPQSNTNELSVSIGCLKLAPELPLLVVCESEALDSTSNTSHGINSNEILHSGALSEEDHSPSYPTHLPVEEDKPSLSNKSSSGMAPALSVADVRDETPPIWSLGLQHPDEWKTKVRADPVLGEFDTKVCSDLKMSSPEIACDTDVVSFCDVINSTSSPSALSQIKQKMTNPCSQDEYEESRVWNLNTARIHGGNMELTHNNTVISKTPSVSFSRARFNGALGVKKRQQIDEYSLGNGSFQKGEYEVIHGRVRPESASAASPRGEVIARFATTQKNFQRTATPQGNCASSSRNTQENHYAVSDCDYRRTPDVFEGDFVATDCDMPYSAGVLQPLQGGVYAVSTLKHGESIEQQQQQQQQVKKPIELKQQGAEDEQLQNLLLLHQQQTKELELDATNVKSCDVLECTQPEADHIERRVLTDLIKGGSTLTSRAQRFDVTEPDVDVDCKTKWRLQSVSNDDLWESGGSCGTEFIVVSSSLEGDPPVARGVEHSRDHSDVTKYLKMGSRPEKCELTFSNVTSTLLEKNGGSGRQEIAQLPLPTHDYSDDDTIKDSNNSIEVNELLMATKILFETSPNSVTSSRFYTTSVDEREDVSWSTSDELRESGDCNDETLQTKMRHQGTLDNSTTSIMTSCAAQDVMFRTEREHTERLNRRVGSSRDVCTQRQVHEDWSLQVSGASGGEPLLAESAGSCPSDEEICSHEELTQEESSDDMRQRSPDAAQDDGHLDLATASESEVDSCEDNTLLETRKDSQIPCPSAMRQDQFTNDLSRSTEGLYALSIENITSNAGASNDSNGTSICNSDGENYKEDIKHFNEKLHAQMDNVCDGSKQRPVKKTTVRGDGKSAKNECATNKRSKTKQAKEVFAGKSQEKGTKQRTKTRTPSTSDDNATAKVPGPGKCHGQGEGKLKKQSNNQKFSFKKNQKPKETNEHSEHFRKKSGPESRATPQFGQSLQNLSPVGKFTKGKGSGGCTTDTLRVGAERMKTKSTTAQAGSSFPSRELLNLESIGDNLIESLKRRGTEVLAKHKKKIEDINASLTKHKPKKKGNKTTYVSLDNFEKREQEMGVLGQRKGELEDQEREFQKFQDTFFTRTLNSGGCFSKTYMKDQQNAFERECSRLKNALPIYGRKTVIVEQVRQNQVSIVLGETGSGKSTQMVQYLYEAGFADNGIIACTQPRKVAATSLCTHVDKEMGGRRLVGCRVGAQSPKNTLNAKILYTTDHALLNECLKDRTLMKYSCIIIDEAHERSIYTDLLLGMIKKALQTRPDLRVVITSATIEPDLFVTYFNGCPVLRVSGRMFPVDVVYEQSKKDYELNAVQTAHKIHTGEEEGDVLVFLTSPAEVEKACEKLQKMHRGEDLECLPLHGKLRQEDQFKVFQSYPGKRKVIFATNCAETSVTVPGVKYVVDSGKVKEMKFDVKRNMSSLVVTDINQSSAEQRKGRAGRTQAGKCYRLYSQEEYEAMNKRSAPEILRIHLGQAILKLMELGVQDPADFDFVESPPKDSLRSAMETLKALGAIKDGRLTQVGLNMARLPLEPRLARLVFQGIDQNVGTEALILAAVATVNGSIFFRMGSDEEKKLADTRKVQFCQEEGDLLTLLAAYRDWSAIKGTNRNKWCYENSLNAKALRIAEDTVKELKLVLKHELKVDVKDTPADQDTASRDKTLRKILLSCYISNLCMFSGHERAGYLAVTLGQCVVLHPSSALKVLNFNPRFAVYGQLLKTSREFLLNVTPIEEEWLDESIQESGLDIDLEKLKASVLKPETYTCSSELMNASLLRRGFTTLKQIEQELTQVTSVDMPVFIEVDKKSGSVTSFAQASCSVEVRTKVEKRLEDGRKELRREVKEMPVVEGCSTVRALMGSGGMVQRLLMPNTYRSVVCKNVPLEIPLQQVLDELTAHGTVVSHRIFDDDRKVIVTYNSPEAVTSVLGAKERFPFNVDVYQTDQNSNCGLKMKLTWCRRPAKGTAQISFQYHEDDIEEVLYSLRIHPPINKYGAAVKFKQDKFHPGRLFLWNLGTDVTEGDIEIAFESACPDVKVTVFLHRQKEFETTQRELDDLKTTLESAVSDYVRMGEFQVQVKPPRTAKDFMYVAYLHFQDVEYGRKALKDLERMRLSTQLTGKVTMTPQLQCTMRCPKDIYALVKDSIEEIKTECLDRCHESCGNSRALYVDIKQCNGKQVALMVNSECIKHYVYVTGAIRDELDGNVIDCSGDGGLDVLLTPGGREALQKVQEKTGALIYSDHKSKSIKIYGNIVNKEAAKRDINSVLEELFITDSRLWDIHLRGSNRPRGLLKAVVSRHGVDLLGLRKLDGVQSVSLDLRSHVLRINGSKDGYDAVQKSVEECTGCLPMEPSKSDEMPDEIECAVCLCPVEGGVYHLACCGHAYCMECAQNQVKTKKFPLQCTGDGCEESFVWKDVQNIVEDKKEMRSLVEASIDHYVTTNPDKVKHCLTPDCGGVYAVSVDGKPFMCYGCQVEICTTCHVRYHQGLSCEAYQSEIKDAGNVEKYLEEHQDTKRCPKCRVLIEKTEGCNHMTCRMCKAHMCWRCLKVFLNGGEVYAHQSKCRF